MVTTGSKEWQHIRLALGLKTVQMRMKKRKKKITHVFLLNFVHVTFTFLAKVCAMSHFFFFWKPRVGKTIPHALLDCRDTISFWAGLHLLPVEQVRFVKSDNGIDSKCTGNQGLPFRDVNTHTRTSCSERFKQPVSRESLRVTDTWLTFTALC